MFKKLFKLKKNINRLSIDPKSVREYQALLKENTDLINTYEKYETAFRGIHTRPIEIGTSVFRRDKYLEHAISKILIAKMQEIEKELNLLYDKKD